MNSSALAFFSDVIPGCGSAGPAAAVPPQPLGTEAVDALFASIIRSVLGDAGLPSPCTAKPTAETFLPDGRATRVPRAEGDPGSACLAAANMLAGRHPESDVSFAPLRVEEMSGRPASDDVQRVARAAAHPDAEAPLPVTRGSMNVAAVLGAAGQTGEGARLQNLAAVTPGGMPDEAIMSSESIPGAEEMETPGETASSERMAAGYGQRSALVPGHGILRSSGGPADPRELSTELASERMAAGTGEEAELSFEDLDLDMESTDRRFFSPEFRAGRSEASAERTFQVISVPGQDGAVGAPSPSAVHAETGDLAPESLARQATSDPAAVRESVLQQLENESFQLLRTRRNEAEIQLHPPELGRIRLRLSVTDASVRGFIEVENPAVKAMLQSDLSRLIQSLAGQGLNLGEFDVQLLEDRPRGHRGQAKQEPSGGRGWREPRNSASGPEVEEVRAASRSSLVDCWM